MFGILKKVLGGGNPNKECYCLLRKIPWDLSEKEFRKSFPRMVSGCSEKDIDMLVELIKSSEKFLVGVRLWLTEKEVDTLSSADYVVFIRERLVHDAKQNESNRKCCGSRRCNMCGDAWNLAQPGSDVKSVSIAFLKSEIVGGGEDV